MSDISSFSFQKTPSLDDFLKPYKKSAKQIAKTNGIALMTALHQVARQFGFTDWQEFNYYFRTLSELELGLTVYEWILILDVLDGHNLYNHEKSYDKASLIYLLKRHEFSLQPEIFIENNVNIQELIFITTKKVEAFIPKELEALFATAFTFWNRPLEHKMVSPFNFLYTENYDD